MLNDLQFFTDAGQTVAATTNAKQMFSENRPYTLLPSSLSAHDYNIIFSNHFVAVFREILSSGDGSPIMKMSKEERAVWYAYVLYQDGTDPVDVDMLAVVEALDNAVVNSLQLKTEDYVTQSLTTDFTWDPLQPMDYPYVARTEKLTTAEYDAKVTLGTIEDTGTYMVYTDSVLVKVYLGLVQTWPAVI